MIRRCNCPLVVMPNKTNKPTCGCDVCTTRRRSAYFPPYVFQPDFLVCKSTRRAVRLVNATHGNWEEVDFAIYESSGSTAVYFGKNPEATHTTPVLTLVKPTKQNGLKKNSNAAAA